MFALASKLSVLSVPSSLPRPAGAFARVVGGALLLALASRTWAPFAGTVVPFTLQGQAVVLLAASVGAPAGLTAVATWFAAACAGLPVFAGAFGHGAALVGPTAGYLWSYPLVVALVGRAGRGRGLRALAVWILANALTLGLGTAWLSAFVGAKAAVAAGLLPFVVGDAAKLLGCFAARRLLLRRG